MKCTLRTLVLAGIGTVAMLGIADAARAAASVSLLGDSGTLQATFYNASNGITGLSVSSVTNPYGVPPITLNTVTAGQWTINFPLSGGFAASANNGGGPAGMTADMDGKLDFIFTLDSAAPLTVGVSEAGSVLTSGDGTAQMLGGIVVSGLNASQIAVETHSNDFPAPTLVGTNGWTNTDQVAGFTGLFTTYHISIDNTLIAEALSSNSAGSAVITKGTFSITLSTGAGAGAPEPASLGVLALGGLALLARRRRA